MKYKNSSKGFTLIELMVVISIIGMLASLAAVGIPAIIVDSQITTTKTQMKNITSALGLYKVKYHKYPSTSTGLKALVKRDANGNSYMQKIPKDAWENSFIYQRRKGQYILISYGVDGQTGGEGGNADIVYSSRDGFNEE